MLGSSHNIDPSFINHLPLSLRDSACALVRITSLKTMLKMRYNSSGHFLYDDFLFSDSEWQAVLNAAILTKVSYFEIEIGFPVPYIDKLIEIISYAYGLPNKPGPVLYQSMIHEHQQLANWIKKALLTKQQTLRKAS